MFIYIYIRIQIYVFAHSSYAIKHFDATYIQTSIHTHTATLTHTNTDIHIRTCTHVCVWVCMFVFVLYICISVTSKTKSAHMGWLRSVGCLKLKVSFAEYSLFYRALLHKRRIMLRSLRIVATPYRSLGAFVLFVLHTFSLCCIHVPYVYVPTLC